MNKKWYLIYVREKKELKTSSLLSRKQIENYCPVTSRPSTHVFRSKEYQEPLLPGYVLAKTTEQELEKIRQLQQVINTVHWKNKPVTLPDNYITSLKSFCNRYQNISVQKSPVTTDGPAAIRRIIGETTVEIYMPLLGYTFTAALPDDGFNTISYIIKPKPADIHLPEKK